MSFPRTLPPSIMGTFDLLTHREHVMLAHRILIAKRLLGGK